MFCENPKYGLYSCGKCRACRYKKSLEKMIVSIFAAHEFKSKGQFLTLTYDDEHKPDGLQHADFANFMKRLRKNTGVKDLKMFMAGEYGELNGREHFHALFYNYKFPIEEIQKAWRDPQTKKNLGFVYDGTCTPQAMKYVSGYVSKRGYDPESEKRPPYGRSSCNIPDSLSDEEIVEMCMTGKVKYNGRLFSVPHNWRRRYDQVWRFFREFRERSMLKEQPKKPLTAKQIRDIMDLKEAKYAMKKAQRMKKRILV